MVNLKIIGIMAAVFLLTIVFGVFYFATSEPTDEPSGPVTPSDPVLASAEPYLNKIVYSNIQLRTEVGSIVKECPSGDKECHLNKIYRYVVENYNYILDPRSSEFIQTPFETISVGGGDCEDLTILLNSLLENAGIRTYLVLTDTHAYSLACGVDTDNLQSYLGDGILIDSEKEMFILKGGYYQYYGGSGSEFDTGGRMDIRYSLSSSKPLSVRVVPSRGDYDLLLQGQGYIHYPSCERSGILQTNGSCDSLDKYGGVIFSNDDLYNDATVNLDLGFYYAPSSPITYYTLDNETCIILEATAGKWGYPGSDNGVVGNKTAIDPVTKEYHMLG